MGDILEKNLCYSVLVQRIISFLLVVLNFEQGLTISDFRIFVFTSKIAIR